MPCSHNTLIILPHERTKSYFYRGDSSRCRHTDDDIPLATGRRWHYIRGRRSVCWRGNTQHDRLPRLARQGRTNENGRVRHGFRLDRKCCSCRARPGHAHFSKAFVALIGFMFAILLLFAAIFQLFLLFFGSRPNRLSSWFFLVPIVLIAAAVYVFMRKPDTQGESTDMIFVGCAFAVFGVSL